MSWAKQLSLSPAMADFYTEKLLSLRKANDDGCWIWPMSTCSGGYGQLWIRETVGHRRWRVHRLSYELFVGPIPIGLDVDHICRNRRCYNFDCLEPVTRKENLRRGIGLAGNPECIRGHALTGDNLRTVEVKGYLQRQCKACAAMRQRWRRGVIYEGDFRV